MSPIRAFRAFFFLTSMILLGTGASAQQGPQHLPSVKLIAGQHVINAELAQTPDERSTGLMFRKTMPTSDGMLFIFEQPGVQCFWMKNTLLPLSVAFIGDDGSVVNIDEMQPEMLDSHCSAKPVRFVLEMNKSWFDSRGVKPGTRIKGSPFAS